MRMLCGKEAGECAGYGDGAVSDVFTPDRIWYTRGMTAKVLKQVLQRVETWREEDHEELAEVARDIEARRTHTYLATPEELAAIDEALGQVARGEVASEEEIEAAFAKFRGA